MLSQHRGSKREERATIAEDDPAMHAEFKENVLRGLLSWVSVMVRVLNEANAKVLASKHKVTKEEIFFRVAVAINTKLTNYLMGQQVSLVQNSIAVVASMIRSHFDQTEPSILAQLENAHDMLRRLDPILWDDFANVIRYVLPLIVKSMEITPQEMPEISSILSRDRVQGARAEIYPLTFEQVGVIQALLDQEDSRQAQAQVIKQASLASRVRSTDPKHAQMAIRFQMSQDLFERAVLSMSTLDLLSILFAFNLAGKAKLDDIPLPDDERIDVLSLHYLLGEGLLFPLNETSLVAIPDSILSRETRRAQGPVSKLPMVFFQSARDLFSSAVDGSLSQDMSSSGEELDEDDRVPVARVRGSSGMQTMGPAIQNSRVSLKQTEAGSRFAKQ